MAHSPTNTLTFLTKVSWVTRGRLSGGKSFGRRRISGRRKRLKRLLNLGSQLIHPVGLSSRTSLRSLRVHHLVVQLNLLLQHRLQELWLQRQRLQAVQCQILQVHLERLWKLSRGWGSQQLERIHRRCLHKWLKQHPARPSRIVSVAEPPLPPPLKGSVARSLAVLEQRPKDPAETQSPAPPVKARPIVPK